MGYIGSMVNFMVKRMPEDLHHAFKVACTIEGITMREKVMELMREYVERQEKKPKK